MFLALKVHFWLYFLPYIIRFATHNCSSPLGSREALINVDKASPGLFILPVEKCDFLGLKMCFCRSKNIILWPLSCKNFENNMYVVLWEYQSRHFVGLEMLFCEPNDIILWVQRCFFAGFTISFYDPQIAGLLWIRHCIL